MDCPNCNATFAITTNNTQKRLCGLPAERKTRKCPMCGHRWTTWEIHEDALRQLKRSANAGEIAKVRMDFLAKLQEIME